MPRNTKNKADIKQNTGLKLNFDPSGFLLLNNEKIDVIEKIIA